MTNEKKKTLTDGYVDTCGQTPPSLPLQGTVPLCWVTPSSMFQMSKAMKTQDFLGCAVAPFPRCARFKDKGMVNVSADAVLPPAGPAPSPGCIPTLSLWEKTCSWVTLWGKLCLYQAGSLVLHIWPKYQSPATIKGREEALWATSALSKMTCVLASEHNHGDTDKSSLVFHATLPPSHCLCREKFPWLLCRWCYI